jgi:hypothetical protein
MIMIPVLCELIATRKHVRAHALAPARATNAPAQANTLS